MTTGQSFKGDHKEKFVFSLLDNFFILFHMLCKMQTKYTLLTTIENSLMSCIGTETWISNGI